VKGVKKMLKWILGKRSESTENRITSLKHISQPDLSSRIDALQKSLPVEASQKLTGLREKLPKLIITPEKEAREELEARNLSRKQVWGAQAATVPITRGLADEVIYALLNCVAADFNNSGATSCQIEEVPAPSTEQESEQVARAREQFQPDMDPRLKAYYEKRLVKHMKKQKPGKGQTAAPTRIRKLVVTVYFRETFGRHEILRVDDDSYYLMPCSIRDQ
jgi:hypothetical protein